MVSLFVPDGALAQDPARRVSQTFAEVSAAARPAVVHIHVEKGRTLAPALQELLQEVEVPPDAGTTALREGSGSGVIVDPSGRIWTNHHVVQDAVSLQVVLSDQRRFPARRVGSDPRTDVAVLQIEAEEPFPSVPVGDSDALRVGDLVIAIGNPFDFQSSVTVGVVSAMGRRGLSDREIQDYIQTDAAVNPGNSGGPLLNLNGEVVGINTAIFSPTGDQNSGISFAIPSNMAGRITGDLEALGRVRRSRVGILARTVSDVEGDPTRRGVEVQWVVPDSPADRAGLRRGDIVVAVDGEPTVSSTALRNLVLARGVGAELQFSVTRDDRLETVQVVVAAEREVGGKPSTFPDDLLIWGGLVVAEPDDALRSHFGIGTERGLLVVEVTPASAAMAMGWLPGDLIVEMEGSPVEDLADLREKLQSTPRARVVGLRRGADVLYGLLSGS